MKWKDTKMGSSNISQIGYLDLKGVGVSFFEESWIIFRESTKYRTDR